MKKPIIGIVAPRTIDDKKPFNNFNRFISNYSKRIIESGGTPLGILCPDGLLDYSNINLFDGFVYSGGSLIESWQIDLLHYALTNDKPVLGICLGMQTIAAYEWLRNEHGDLSYDIIDSTFTPSDEEHFLKKVQNHNSADPYYTKDIDKSKHKINLKEGSQIYEIFKSKHIYEPSLHNFCVIPSVIEKSDTFEITGWSPDGIVEVIEKKDRDSFVVGVQFHPELEKENEVLFEKFINHIKKQKISENKVKTYSRK